MCNCSVRNNYSFHIQFESLSPLFHMSILLYNKLSFVLIVSLFVAGSQLIKKDKDGSVISAYVDRDGIQYKHTHLDIGMGFGHTMTAAPLPSVTCSNERMSKTNKQNTSAFYKSVDVMETPDAGHDVALAQNRKEKKQSGKFGGFFSRLASFRFSLKKGVNEKGKVYRQNVTVNKPGN